MLKVYLRLPKLFIFFIPKNSRYFFFHYFEQILHQIYLSILKKLNLNIFHFLKEFFDILQFNNIILEEILKFEKSYLAIVLNL